MTTREQRPDTEIESDREICGFDIHCHTMTLDHPNLLAFAQRFLTKMPLTDRLVAAWHRGASPYVCMIVCLATGVLLLVGGACYSFGRLLPTGLGLVISALVVGLTGLLIWVCLRRLETRARDWYANVVLPPLKRAVNLLAEMGSAMGDQYVMLERCLSDRWGGCADKREPACLVIRDRDGEASYGYRRLVLTPLIMDFGAKGLLDRRMTEYYRELPRKPVIKQASDVLEGIAYYVRHTECRLFEIYPFLGLNPQLYPLDERMDTRVSRLPRHDPTERPEGITMEEGDGFCYVITKGSMSRQAKHWLMEGFAGQTDDQFAIKRLYDDSNREEGDRGVTIPALLSKYFRDYTGRRADLFAQMGTFRGDIDCVGSNVFAGIKLYPPLGFDPWPSERCEYQREKVEYLYTICQCKQIPITVHCSDGGFVGTKDGAEAMRLMRPQKWAEVLRHYPRLCLNLAHLGHQANANEWQEVVLELVSAYPNVYTDFANRAFGLGFYESLSRLVERCPKLTERILFGSDFMINLLETDSYAAYYEPFLRAENAFSAQDRHLFFHENPKRFLFGGATAR